MSHVTEDAVTVPEPPHTGAMHIQDKTGDTKLVWDYKNDDEVANAKRTFDDLKAKGFLAYSVGKDGEPGEVLHSFDPKAEKIIMSPPMAGG